MPELATDFQQAVCEVLIQFGLRDLYGEASLAWRYEVREVDIPQDIPEWVKLLMAEGNKELKSNRQLVAEFVGVEPQLLFSSMGRETDLDFSLVEDVDDQSQLWQIHFRPDKGRCVEKY